MKGVKGARISIEFVASMATAAASFADFGTFDVNPQNSGELFEIEVDQSVDTHAGVITEESFTTNTAANEHTLLLSMLDTPLGSDRASRLTVLPETANKPGEPPQPTGLAGESLAARVRVSTVSHHEPTHPSSAKLKSSGKALPDPPRPLATTVRPTSAPSPSNVSGTEPAAPSILSSQSTPSPGFDYRALRLARLDEFDQSEYGSASGMGDVLFLAFGLLSIAIAYSLRPRSH